MHIAPKGYDEGMVEKLVQTLGLQAKVVYLGEDAHTKKIWQSYKKRAGTIVYSYFPNINQHGIPILSLHRAEIPPEEDFKPQQLRKLAWPGLQKHRGGDALEFVQNFDLTQKDYTELSRLFDLFGEPQAAACVWIKENPDRWAKWVNKFPERKATPIFCWPKYGKNKKSGLCGDVSFFVGWVVFLIQLLLFFVIMAYAHHLRTKKSSPQDRRSKIQTAISGRPLEENLHHHGSVMNLLVDHAGNYKSRLEFVDKMHNVPVCLRHIRTYENFSRSNTDAKLMLPPEAPSDRWSAELKRSSLFPYLFFSRGHDGMKPVLLQCLALGLLSGPISTFCYQYIKWETYRFDPVAHSKGIATMQDGTFTQTLQQSAEKFESLITAFKFFPAFLQIGYLGYAVSRWREFQEYGYCIMGAIHSTALLVGSSLTDANNPACQQLVWRVYRYLTAIHIITYLKLNVWLKELKLDDFYDMGL